jgi:hypothetical protein
VFGVNENVVEVVELSAKIFLAKKGNDLVGSAHILWQFGANLVAAPIIFDAELQSFGSIFAYDEPKGRFQNSFVRVI